MKDLNLLFTFEALWRDRSVTLAAERLGVSQAAVSGSLKRLREHYGDQLFSLVGRRMQPTPLSIEMAPHLLDALALVRQTGVERGRFDPASARRVFTMRTRDIGEVVCLPPLLAAMASCAPGIRLRTVFRPIPETMTGLASGQIDLALGFLPSLETSIHRRLLFTQHYVCVMRRGHPLADVPLSADAFAAGEHLLVEYSGSGHVVLERALVEAGARHRIKLRLPQYLAAPHFVVSSDLLWSVPAVLAERLSMHYPLAIHPHPLPLPEFEVALYWHDRFHRDPANMWLRQFMVEMLHPQADSPPGAATPWRKVEAPSSGVGLHRGPRPLEGRQGRAGFIDGA
ncbi:LysR family transcriptional regulator [Aquabacterium sp. J223]|uniref:LysR family transcriptional regulator n=1 Tax=Aquabacterium sp. J223 TaxID=2898431 RepID=UPI0021AD8FCC|nr:LysR family transcriptional regulator [Aquabacterium sp. J223]UUX95352.1 LysR family transcriptional regulator [Aquabacterium sp. J223]